MSTVNLTIDGKEIEVEAGTTILEAAEELEIEIPTLCHHPNLTPDGSCRVCVVEDVNSGELVPACATPVSDGLEIKTATEQVLENRKLNLELLLSNHPDDCMTCEADGNCELQDLVYEYEITDPTFGTLDNRQEQVESDNPFIEFDADKCILCGRCVRVCKEIQVSDALEFSQRGHEAKVFTGFGDDIEDEISNCVHCGQCAEICPTGALTYKPSKNKVREYNLDDKVRTTCPYCGVGCQLELKIKDNELVEVGSIYQEGLPNPAGETCVKGRFGHDFVNHPDRLTKPLIKKDGEFTEASWEEALDYTAERLTEIKEEAGGEAVANLTSARCTNEENYVIQKFMRSAVGTNAIDHCAHL